MFGIRSLSGLQTRRQPAKAWLSAALVLALALCGWRLYLAAGQGARSTVTIGVLHSLSGTMASEETPLIDALRLAVEEINAGGGVNGSRIKIETADGHSNPAIFATEAERLITQKHVAALFGCWTSACRKAVKDVVERHDHLLLYPLQYEGLEQSPNIVYLGEAPNQQIIPAVSWALQNLGKRLYLIGSDYVFPRIANTLIRRQVELLGGEIAGEAYRPLGDRDFTAIAQNIARLQPDAVLNSVNGDSNIAMFQAMRAAGITPDKLPVLSFSIGTDQAMGQLPGDYAAWSYFQSLPNAANRVFVEAFQQRYGRQRRLSSPMEASYAGVKLWAAAASKAGDFSAPMVRNALEGISIAAPGGPLILDKASQHAWKTARIGRFVQDGACQVVWSSEAPIRPEPFPLFFSRKEWLARLGDLYRGYGNRWAALVKERP